MGLKIWLEYAHSVSNDSNKRGLVWFNLLFSKASFIIRRHFLRLDNSKNIIIYQKFWEHEIKNKLKSLKNEKL